MYCMKCGAQNQDTAKFCIKCGRPLGRAQPPVLESEPEVELAPRSRPAETAPRMTLGSKIAGLAATIAVIGFFLPWVTVSCAGSELMTMSGYEVAQGGVVQTLYGPSDPMPSNPLLFVAPGAAVLICLIFYVAYARGRIGLFATLIQAVLAGVGAWQIFAVLNQLRAEYGDPDMLIQASVQTEYGFWMTVFGLGAVIGGNLLSVPDILRQRALARREKPPPGYRRGQINQSGARTDTSGEPLSLPAQREIEKEPDLKGVRSVTFDDQEGWMSEGYATSTRPMIVIGLVAGAIAVWVGYLTGHGPVYNPVESLVSGTAASAVVGALLLTAKSLADGLGHGNTHLRRSPPEVMTLAMAGAMVGALIGFFAVLTIGLGFRFWIRWAYDHGGPYPPNLPLWAKVVLGGMLGSVAARLVSLFRG